MGREGVPRRRDPYSLQRSLFSGDEHDERYAKMGRKSLQTSLSLGDTSQRD